MNPPEPDGVSHALVESPLQLLCTVEAHAAGLLGPRTRVLLRDDVPGLSAALDSLRATGLPEGLTIDTRSPWAIAADRSPIRATGDACSGLFQALLLVPGRVPQLTLIDDGLATLDLVARLADPSQPLLRPGKPASLLRRAVGHAAARAVRRLAGRGRLEIFTALALPEPDRSRVRELGVQIVPNSLEWLRSRPRSEVIAEPTVVIGAALVADGLVDAESYVMWMTKQAASGPVRYIPHRRHRREVVERIAALPGVTVAEPGAPVEVRLRGLSAGQRVICLPTTAALLLPPLLEPRGVAIEVHDVAEDWWTPRASPALREHLREVLRQLPDNTVGAP
ncbi:hypothetical protein [Myceligenerans indicum]|uniref:Uncharacterized protein n=1 Tax=Myceligenerans indicum TaxID=2593663 RepID=A0ABS1LHZ7_9MICO|nr:hypothetical protein [Myceligenerans indicum]MBL0885860.1 hypothetical protein [Myceligenerans indicum]